ncbi:MAG: O-methyltransferase [Candidatus Heimdallarchaeota archaeon]|nr:O-methyltransferase [Candidatus Heimdallarchaeota archaeon]
MKDELLSLLKDLERIDADERKQGLPVDQRMRNIQPEVGLFLNILIKATKAKTILEIGTSNAYSTIWIGLAAKENNGKVITLENDPKKTQLAKENLGKAGLLNIVQIIQGDAKETIKGIEETLDLIFIDAEKEDYIDFFDLTFPKLKVGGLIVADNVVSHDSVLKPYVDHVRNNPQTQSVLVPIGRGEELTLKIR